MCISTTLNKIMKTLLKTSVWKVIVTSIIGDYDPSSGVSLRGEDTRVEYTMVAAQFLMVMQFAFSLVEVGDGCCHLFY